MAIVHVLFNIKLFRIRFFTLLFYWSLFKDLFGPETYIHHGIIQRYIVLISYIKLLNVRSYYIFNMIFKF